MNNKKIFIIVIIIIIVFSTLSILLLNKQNKQIKRTTPTHNIIDNNIEEEEIKEDKPKEEIKKEETKKEEEKKEEVKVEKTPPKNQTTQSKKTNTVKAEKKPTNTKPNTNTNNNSNNTNTTPKPTYSCPNGYTLSGTVCNSIINANLVCPSGTQDYTNGYCINLSEGYEVEESTVCPEGYSNLRYTTIGAPDTYKCHPITQKIYTCPNGYSSYNTNKCIKTINATAH